MQIYEVTKPGILKTIGQDIKSAVLAPFQKAGAILNTPGSLTDPLKAQSAMNTYRQGQAQELETQVQQRLSTQVAQQTQDRAEQLTQQWLQKNQTRTAPTVAKPVAPPVQRSVLPTITLGGQLLTFGPDNLWHNETGAAVTDPAQAAKINKAYQDREYRKKQFQQTAIIKEAPLEYTTSAGIVVPGSAKTDKTNVSNDATGFVAWSDQQLDSVIPGTKQQINMDMIRKDLTLSPTVKTALDRVLKDPTNARAVQDYFETAMKAMQKMSAQLKQSAQVKKSNVSGNSAGLLDRYVDSATIDKLQDLAKNPTYASLIKKELGIN